MGSGRVLGIDYGDVRTGLALSDESGFLASGLCTLEAGGEKRLIEKIMAEIDGKSISEIVVVDPVNIDGTHGRLSEKASAFAKKLELRTGIPVKMFDERRTTIAAGTFMNETNTRGRKRKAVVDTLSAEIILQNYLDYKRNTSI